MQKRALYFIFTFLLAVFIFLAFASAFNPFGIFKKQSPAITGDVIAIKDNTQILNSAKCVDSDGGVFSEIAGNVSIRKAMQWGLGDKKYKVYYDYCIRNTTLVEYYCDKNIVKSARFVCKDGCERGECTSGSDYVLGKGEINFLEPRNINCPEDCTNISGKFVPQIITHTFVENDSLFLDENLYTLYYNFIGWANYTPLVDNINLIKEKSNNQFDLARNIFGFVQLSKTYCEDV